jgi:putative PIN family toxin of toxin-antitoxin system
VIPVVYDTNVLVSGTVSTTGAAAQLIDAWRSGQCTLITSEPILEEVIRTLAKPYFQAHLAASQIQDVERLLRRWAIVTPLTVTVQGVATHPEDDVVLATAVSGKAEYLVTHDKKLQGVEEYQGVKILRPYAFLDLLRRT